MRRVIRPGLFQWIYIMLVPAFCIGIGVYAITYGFTMEVPDWGSRLPAGLALIAVGVLIALYFVGMSIEVTDGDVSKVRLFGLWRTTIPLAGLSASTGRLGRDTTVVRFANRHGGSGFGVYKMWIWRDRDVDDLVTLAHHR